VNWKNVDVPIHLEASECMIYHSALMKPKSQSDLDWLRQLHILDKTEDDLDESWECTEVLKYCEDSGMDMSTNHNCQVEWNDINKSESWVNFFALSLSNPTPIISFTRKYNLLDIMAFQYLVHARKPQGCQTKRSVSSEDTKIPKIIKSASSIEEQKLDILPNPKKVNPTVTKSHEDSHSNNSKLSVKTSFWGSPDLSSGIEKHFGVMGLYDKSETLIISMNLCSIQNMIQLSNLDLHDFGNMFSRQDLRDSVFQDSIIKVICLGKCFKMLIQEINELDDDADVTKQLIPSTFEEETNLLNTENIETLRIHYMAHSWQIRKDFLNYLKDFTTQDSLIGSVISTTSKKLESSVSKVSSPSVLSDNTDILKTSAKSNAHDFYPKH
jgi:hypothetical protein